ncbi:helix-turn-helix domain-containing protein [Paenibacillus sp. FSL K6-2524]|uniref:helix-turn-helix domain-containing protein n=1 Tax=Paenibacillus sp. FSL K6-2524 TaxID=2954516 RepID=UPI0030FCD675
MSNISITVGEKIRELRQQRGFSQEKLAFKAGITPSYMGQIERGEKSPTIDTLDKVTRALNIELSDLFVFTSNETSDLETTHIDKITYQLLGRTPYEQEEIFNFIKRLLKFRDNKN